MESSVEQRLSFLEARVKTLEGLLEVEAAPAPPRQPFPPQPAPAAPVAPARPAPPLQPPRDLEDLLGGRVLAWLGGVAVVIAAVFFVVMAVRNGWIGEAARMELAFAVSAAFGAAGAWLYERRGQTQAALATERLSLRNRDDPDRRPGVAGPSPDRLALDQPGSSRAPARASRSSSALPPAAGVRCRAPRRSARRSRTTSSRRATGRAGRTALPR